MKPHRNLEVWKKSISFVTKVYKITDKFPVTEQFGLTSQMRRASISIPSNIAEGAARRSSKESIQFYYVSRGSISELDTQVEICKALGFINDHEYNELCLGLEEISRMLQGLITYRNK